MISIRRSDQYALHFKFDREGAAQMFNVAEKALADCSDSISIKFDRRLTSKSAQPGLEARHLTILRGEDDLIEFDSSGLVKLELTVDMIENLKERLADCIESGDFIPAEFCELQVKGSKKAVDTYFIFEAPEGEVQKE